jgi:hypothetical protein
MGGFNIPANLNSDIVQSPQWYTSCYLNFALAYSVICRIYILRSPVKILFCLVPPIVFSFMSNPFFIWGPYASEHGRVLIWKYRIECSMFTAIGIQSFGMDQNCTVDWCKYWVALNPGLGGVGSNMRFHYRPWSGTNKPSLQYFHICRVWWLSKFSFHPYIHIYIIVCCFRCLFSISLSEQWYM